MQPQTILITGGAGYIGSGMVQKLVNEGKHVIVVDNLAKGRKSLVSEAAKFYEGDLLDTEFLEQVFTDNKIDAVIHFAAYKAVGESMIHADKYSHNIIGSLNLLNAMVNYGVKHIIFSSTAAVYQTEGTALITENNPVRPENYYGATKHVIEEQLQWYAQIHGLQYTIFRYFNVAGDTGLAYVDPNAQNIFPIISEVVAGKREKLTIFGNDYPTKDGTGVRDYVDVNDLLEAHYQALGLDVSEIINLGTGKGYSVLDLVRTFEKVSAKKVAYEFGERRAGDPAKVVAAFDKAKRILGWEPRYSLEDTVASTLGVYL